MSSRQALFEKAAEAQKEGNRELALSCYNDALRLDRSDSGAWNAAGHMAMALSRFHEAQRAFQEYARLLPREPSAWLSVGHAFSAAGDAVGARSAFLKCLSLELEDNAKRHGLTSVLEQFSSPSGFRTDIDPLTMQPSLPPIFIASLPKSGTVFVQNALTKGLGKRPLGIPSGGLFPHVTIAQNAVEALYETGAVYVIHCAANQYNKIELSAKLDRMAIHIRDPRQALISWAKFMPDVVDHLDPIQARHFGMPADLSQRNFSTQLDWHIENTLPGIVDFIGGWDAADRDPSFETRTYFTSHELLATDQRRYFAELLEFFEISPERFQFPDSPKIGAGNFREGSTNEWQGTMTAEQCRRARKLVPDHLFERFDWLD